MNVHYLHLRFSPKIEKVMGLEKTPGFDPKAWAKAEVKNVEVLDLSKEADAWLQAQALRCLGQFWVPDLRGLFDSEFLLPQLLAWARSHGVSHIATGHRARLSTESEVALWKSRDEEHDQSAWVAQAGRKIFKNLLLPLGYLKFAELERLAIKHSFANEGKELVGEEQRLLDSGKVFEEVDTRPLSLTTAKGYVVDKLQQVYGEHAGLMRFRAGTRQGFESLFGMPPDYVAHSCDLSKQWLIIAPSKKVLEGQFFVGNRVEWCTASAKMFSDSEPVEFQVGFEKALRGQGRARLLIDSMLRIDRLEQEGAEFPYAFGRRITLYRGALCLGSMQVLETQ